MKNNVLCALGLVMLSAGGVASAVQYTWNLSNPTNGTYSNGITYSSEGGSLNFTSTSGDKTLKVNAFRTSSSDGSGLLQDAKVTSDGNWGLGPYNGVDLNRLEVQGRDPVLDDGHPLTGPVYIRGAQPDRTGLSPRGARITYRAVRPVGRGRCGR